MSRKYRSIKTQTLDDMDINTTILKPIRSHIYSNQSLVVLYGQKSTKHRTHCHFPRSEGVNIKSRTKLLTLSVLCLLLMIGEIVGGIWCNSLAVIIDASRLCIDFASFMIVLFTIWIASRPATQRYNFGWYRAEVIAALLAVLIIWFVIAGLSYMSVKRLVNDNYEIKAEIMLITSGVAVFFDFLMGLQLRQGYRSCNFFGKNFPGKPEIIQQPYRPRLVVLDYSKHLVCSSSERFKCPFRHQGSQTESSISLKEQRSVVDLEDVNETENLKSLCFYALRDALQSFGVFAAGLVIYLRPDFKFVDPLLAVVCSFIIFYATLGIIRDALMVLMESTPNFMDYNEILQLLLAIPGVRSVHNLRIWALNLNRTACLAHLEIQEGFDPLKILQMANSAIHQRFNFYETTLQIE